MFFISTKSFLISISFFPINAISSAYANSFSCSITNLYTTRNHFYTHRIPLKVPQDYYTVPQELLHSYKPQFGGGGGGYFGLTNTHLVHHSTCVTGSRGTKMYRHLLIFSGHWATLQSIATRTFKKLDKPANRLCCRNVIRSKPQLQGRLGEWRGNILTTETCICTQVAKAQHCR